MLLTSATSTRCPSGCGNSRRAWRNWKERTMNKMEIREILNYLPHRFPFLLIDRVLSCEPGKNIVALKNVAVNEPYFQGHFPGNPVMPGVMILEALAQAAAILSFQTLGKDSPRNLLYYFVGIDNA